ncbi:MAG: hypothetical protein IPK76_01805 [Lewinellaceae bacterium]|nr:hypothetical protein [Lewinellaceae bacterium]
MREKLRSNILFCVAFLLLSLAACRVSPDDSDILVTADPEFSVDLLNNAHRPTACLPSGFG